MTVPPVSSLLTCMQLRMTIYNKGVVNEQKKKKKHTHTHTQIFKKKKKTTEMTVRYILALWTVIQSCQSFEYKTAGKWYSSEDHGGMIDLSGVEQLRLDTLAIVNGTALFQCRSIRQSMATWIIDGLTCEELMRSGTVLECRPASSSDITHAHKLSLICPLDMIELHFVFIQVHMACDAFGFPSNYIRDGRRCTFTGTVTEGVHNFLEFVGHLFGISMFFFVLGIGVIKRKDMTIKTLIAHVILYGMYIPSLLVGYARGSLLLSFVLLIIWFMSVIYYTILYTHRVKRRLI